MNSELQNSQPEESPKPGKPSEFPWFGVILILLGILFLAQQFGDFTFNNWWALFILIPVFSAFGTAYGMWRKAGRFNFAVWSTFYGGLFPLLVALIFLFNLEWGDNWPLFVILGGLGMMIGGLPFRRAEDATTPAALLCHRPWGIFVGLSAILLGLRFMGIDLGIIENILFFNVQNWWGIYILIPALGGIVTALLLLFGGHSVVLVLINLALAAVITLAGMVALLGLDWELMNMAAPLILILVGLGLIIGFGGKKDQE